MSSTETKNQIVWVQERLHRIQASYQKTIIGSPYLKEVIYDFTELTQSLFTITQQALKLSQLIHADYTSGEVSLKLDVTEELLSKVEQSKNDILEQVNNLIEYYNHLAVLASQISGKPNPKLPFDTLRYMKTLRRYINSEHEKTNKQLLDLQKFTRAEYISVNKISLDSEHADKKRYLDIQKVIARVVKCYIALAGHTQLTVKPVVKSAHELVDLEACPTCNFAITVFRRLAPSLASYALKNFLNKQSHIMFLGCENKIDAAVLNTSIVYDALYEELRELPTLDSFWDQAVVKLHRNDVLRRFEKKMMTSLVSVNPEEFWKIIKFLAHGSPSPSELKNGQWEEAREVKSGDAGHILSIQQTGEGLGKAILQRPGLGFSDDKEIENIRLDNIWSLVAHFSSFLTEINIRRRNQESV